MLAVNAKINLQAFLQNALHSANSFTPKMSQANLTPRNFADFAERRVQGKLNEFERVVGFGGDPMHDPLAFRCRPVAQSG